MGKSKRGASDEPAVKVKAEKKYTRAQAERALSAGVNPEIFVKHPNYHVRAKAFRMGTPALPSDPAEQETFLKSIHQWEAWTKLSVHTLTPEIEATIDPVVVPIG